MDIDTPLACKKLLALLQCRFRYFFLELGKLTDNLVSAITVVSSNLFGGLPPRNRISFFFYSIICMHWWTSLSHLLFYEKFERDLNPIPQTLYPYLSESTFLVTFTTPIKQVPVLNFLFISLCNESYWWIKQMYHAFL